MQYNSQSSYTLKDLLFLLDEFDHSLIANNIYFTLYPDGQDYDFLEIKDEKHSLEYIFSHIHTGIEIERKKFSKLKKMVGCLVIRKKLSLFMNNLEKEFGCNFYFEDIGIDNDNISLHNDISRIIIEAANGATQAQNSCN